MRRRLLLAAVLVAVVTVSVAAYYRSSTSTAAPEYATAVVTRGTVVDTIAATGTLQTVETVEVGTQVSGSIASLHADFNSRVTAGQVVARLEPSLFQTQVDQAEASVVRLQAEVERARVTVEDTALKLTRARELSERQLISRNDLETAEASARQAEASLKAAQAQVAQAQASLDQNRVNLSHTVIKAPITGVVISRNVDVGQTVAASMSAPTLFVIARDLSRMQVNARIDEADIGRVRPGQAVTFRVDAYPGDSFTGKVAQVRLEPVVESNVVSYVTVIDAPNPALKLKPGMTANVTIEVAREEDVLRVPSSALRFQPPPNPNSGDTAAATRGQEPRGGGARVPRVWILREGQPQPLRVTTGLSDGAVTAVTGGELTEHAAVITGLAPTSAAAQRSASPLIPSRPRGGRQGGGG